MPFPTGLQSAANAFLSASFSAQCIVAVLVLFLIYLLLGSVHKDAEDAPVDLPAFSLLNVYPFYRRRFEFLTWGFRVTGQSIFKFNLLRKTVVVVSGDAARQAFFSTKGFDLTEGFNFLSGAIPMVRGVTSELHTRRISQIHKRLGSAQKNAQLSDLIPLILDDCRKVMETWGSQGTFDPFDNIYELMFQTTVRSLSCSEIADDSALVARLKKLYDTLDMSTTPATVLMPWFPSWAMIKKTWATKTIYDIVTSAIKTREESGVSRNDTLQMLLDSGDEKLVIVGFIMGLLIAGARATGNTACWILTFLGSNSDWKAKAIVEAKELLASCPFANNKTDTPSTSAHLASIPLEVWESATPVLDAIIHETLRLAQPHTAMRRNLGPEVHINNCVIPTGTYVIYPFSDVHLNPDLYPSPWKFDPARPQPTKAAFGFIGWGGGKTMCLGSRLAKLELKLIVASFLLGVRYELVNVRGDKVDAPKPNWNDILHCRPPKGSCLFSFESSNETL